MLRNIVLSSVVLAVFATECEADKILPLPIVTQEQSLWCWAACSQAILQYYGTTVNQCSIVDWARQQNQWGDDNCCDNGSGSICNQGNPTDEGDGSVDAILNHWGVSNNKLYNYALNSNRVISIIDSGKPFMMTHAVVQLIGYMWDGSKEHIIAINPKNGKTKSIASFDSFSSVHLEGMTLDRVNHRAYLMDNTPKIYVVDYEYKEELEPITPDDIGSSGFLYKAYSSDYLIGLRYNGSKWEIITISITTGETVPMTELSNVEGIYPNSLSVSVIDKKAYILDASNKIHVVDVIKEKELTPITPDNGGSNLTAFDTYSSDYLIGLRYNGSKWEIIGISKTTGKTVQITELSNANAIVGGFHVDDLSCRAYVIDSNHHIYVADLINYTEMDPIVPDNSGSGAFGIASASFIHDLIGYGYYYENNILNIAYLDPMNKNRPNQNDAYDAVISDPQHIWIETFLINQESSHWLPAIYHLLLP